MVSTHTPGTGWRTWGVSPTVTFVAGDQPRAVRAGGAVEIYRNGGLLYIARRSRAGPTPRAAGASALSRSRTRPRRGSTTSAAERRRRPAAAESSAGGGGGRLAGERERAARRDVLGGGLVGSRRRSAGLARGRSATGRTARARARRAYLRESGTYAALLTVTDGRGGQDTASVEIVANTPPPNRPPVAVAGGSAGERERAARRRISAAGSSDPDGDPGWATRGRSATGRTARGASVAHTYANPGTYCQVLTVTDGRGGQDTASVEIVANTPPPEPAAGWRWRGGSPASGNAPLVVTFSAAGFVGSRRRSAGLRVGVRRRSERRGREHHTRTAEPDLRRGAHGDGRTRRAGRTGVGRDRGEPAAAEHLPADRRARQFQPGERRGRRILRGDERALDHQQPARPDVGLVVAGVERRRLRRRPGRPSSP